MLRRETVQIHYQTYNDMNYSVYSVVCVTTSKSLLNYVNVLLLIIDNVIVIFSFLDLVKRTPCSSCRGRLQFTIDMACMDCYLQISQH